MTHSDELVERVARIIYYETRRFGDRGIWEEPRVLSDQHIMSDQEKRPFVYAARAALSAMPGHELLREALEALAPMASGLKEAGYYCPDDVADDHVVLISVTIAELRDANAIREKLRAELEVG